MSQPTTTTTAAHLKEVSCAVTNQSLGTEETPCPPQADQADAAPSNLTETVYVLGDPNSNKQSNCIPLIKHPQKLSKLKTIRPNMLNYSDPEEIENNKDLLDEEQLAGLREGLSQYKDDRLYTQKYKDNLYFMIHAKPAFLSKYCLCGIKVRHGNKRTLSTCKRRNFCPRCCLAKSSERWKRYLTSYNPEQLWFVTFSFNHGIPFNTLSCYTSLVLWDVIRDTLKAALECKNSFIKGYLLSEELSIEQFLPLSVLPHNHALILADHIDQSDVDNLATVIDTMLGKLNLDGLETPLKASIKLTHLKTKLDFKNLLRYPVKPIEIKKAYTAAWSDKVKTNLQRACELNGELYNFVIGSQLIKHMPVGRRQLVSGGEFSHRSHNYKGNKNIKSRKCWNEVKRIPCTTANWKLSEHSD